MNNKQKIRTSFIMKLLVSSCVLVLAQMQNGQTQTQNNQEGQADGWMTISQLNALPYQSTPASQESAAAGEVMVSNPPPTVFPASRGGALAKPGLREEDIYLDVTVNGELRDNMYPFQQLPSGSLLIRADDLRAIGILPIRSVTNSQGFVDLDRLPNVTYLFADDDLIHFITTDESALAPFTTSLSSWSGGGNIAPLDEDDRAQSDLTGVLNYSLYGNTGGTNLGRIKHLNSLSGTLEARVSGRLGTVSTSQLVRYHPDFHNKFDTIRLESYWNYSDEERMLTYQLGDVITRSLAWSRSTRLGGFQLRRNFSLREDLLTTPMPSITGSAALPSTVDVYINNAQIATKDIPAGPYSLTNMPIISGANDARIVVRDATGRETVTNMAFFSDASLLGKGLLDFALEAGVPRRNFGIKSGDYSGDLMVSATARYGLNDRVTLEGHAEAGRDFFNSGIGTTLSLSDVGALSLAGSTSVYRSSTGQQLYASLQLQRWGFYFNARTQRTYSHYNDIASVVDARAQRENLHWINSGAAGFFSDYSRYGAIRPPKAINQLSLSTNLRFDPTTINVAFTQIDHWDEEDSRLLSISASRNLAPRVHAYANAYLNLKDSKGYGIFGGISVMFDDKISASSNVITNHHGSSITTQLSRSMSNKIGDYGLTLHDTEGKQTQRGVDGHYRAKFATMSASLSQYNNDNWRASAQMDGSLVFADGAMTPAPRIYNSFAVIDAGVGDVGIYVNNSYFDKTWRDGRLIIPDLYSHRSSNIKLDMENLPVDTLIESNEIKIRPATRSGVIVKFGASAASYAHVRLVDQNGHPIETGSYAQLVGFEHGFDVGYDGIGVLPLEGVRLPAKLDVEISDNRYCQATVPAAIKSGVSAGTQALSCLPVAR